MVHVNTYHIIQGELCSLCHNVSINCHHGTAIIVNTVSITAPLVGIQIDTSTLQQHQQYVECSTDVLSNSKQKMSSHYADTMSYICGTILPSIDLCFLYVYQFFLNNLIVQ